ncbi:MAG TPA: hypothetical protein PL081_06135, partial [Pseudomonadales bacterium]|nr:hypothetical protein [Pseudomonadales bacterium]
VEDYDYFIRAARQFRFAHIAEPLYYFKRDDATLYISRYCEVKASDLLVRYRNGLLDGAGVVEAVVELLLRNIAGLKNPLLRGGHALLRTRSFRLTNWHAKLTSHHLRRQLHGPVLALLDGYRQQQRSFGESRQALVALINALGAVSYQ